MTDARFDGDAGTHGAEVPEADRWDQLTPADPGDEEAPEPVPLAAAKEPVSEGDWVEQQRVVPLDDEDGAEL